MTKAWRGIGASHAQSGVRTWLLRIVANAAADEHRHRGHRPVPVDHVPDRIEPVEWADPLSAAPEHTIMVRGQLPTAPASRTGKPAECCRSLGRFAVPVG